VSFVRFAPLSDVPAGRNKTVRIGLKHIAVFNVAGTLYAIEDACSHMKAPLSGGRLNGMALTCSRHGWVYDLASGLRTDKPEGRVRVFPVKVDAGMIYVDPAVPDPEPCAEPGDCEDDPPPIAL
jgi:nitrite reductase/ring-hydroxylating ferredoxin subunit